MIAMLKVQYPGNEQPMLDAEAAAVVGRAPDDSGRQFDTRSLAEAPSVRDLTWFNVDEPEFPLHDKLKRLGLTVTMLII